MAVTENHEAVDEEMRQKTSNDRVVIRTSRVFLSSRLDRYGCRGVCSKPLCNDTGFFVFAKCAQITRFTAPHSATLGLLYFF